MSSEQDAVVPRDRVRAHARALDRDLGSAVQSLVDALGKPLVAAIAGRDLKTVGRWLSGHGPRRDYEQRRVWNALQIVELLLTDKPPSTVRAWFMAMNPSLDDQSPTDALAEGNRERSVMRARACFRGC